MCTTHHKWQKNRERGKGETEVEIEGSEKEYRLAGKGERGVKRENKGKGRNKADYRTIDQPFTNRQSC